MKSRHPRWFNPTKDAMWDLYYEGVWKFWALVLLFAVAVVLGVEIGGKI